MATKQIKIYTTLGSPGTITADANTLGELRPFLHDQGINISGMKLLIGETRNELSEDSAILPQGDFKLYLVPSKTKSGLGEDTLRLITLLPKLEKMATLLLEVKTIAESLTPEDRIAMKTGLGKDIAKSLLDTAVSSKVSLTGESKPSSLSPEELKEAQEIERILQERDTPSAVSVQDTDEWDRS